MEINTFPGAEDQDDEITLPMNMLDVGIRSIVVLFKGIFSLILILMYLYVVTYFAIGSRDGRSGRTVLAEKQEAIACHGY